MGNVIEYEDENNNLRRRSMTEADQIKFLQQRNAALVEALSRAEANIALGMEPSLADIRTALAANGGEDV